jgi:hypothetical protein
MSQGDYANASPRQMLAVGWAVSKVVMPEWRGHVREAARRRAQGDDVAAETGRGLADAIADCKKPSKARQRPSWLITQPFGYRIGYWIGQVWILVVAASTYADGHPAPNAWPTALAYIRSLSPAIATMPATDIGAAHRAAILDADVPPRSFVSGALLRWLADKTGAFPASSGLDIRNYERILLAMGDLPGWLLDEAGEGRDGPLG